MGQSPVQNFDLGAYLSMKEQRQRQIAKENEQLREEHPLSEVLFEMTTACNLSCLHCGSDCQGSGSYIDADGAMSLIDEVAGAYGTDGIRMSFTGGEPLLHPRFFDVARHSQTRGFRMGMTTNGTLITPDIAKRLLGHGVTDITVSLDGLEESHDRFRNRAGSWQAAVDGIQNLSRAGIAPSVTTVANALNIGELREMRHLMDELGIGLWRITAVDPIGRALEHPELLLGPDGTVEMYSFIEASRAGKFGEPAEPETTTSCAHYLGTLHEGEARNWFFSCRSGLTVASVTAAGEYVGCLDVQRKEELVMGHLGHDSFVEAWENGYGPYRQDRAKASGKCRSCEHAPFCCGDSMHTWDFDGNCPMYCIGMP